MKNAIKFFYGIDVDSIRQVVDKYYLFCGNDRYLLEGINDNINDYVYLVSSNTNYHSIIYNLSNSVFTNINGNKYVLLKTNCLVDRINYSDLFNNVYYGMDNISSKIISLWSKRVDYSEYQVSQFGIKYPILRDSFAYYNGLTINAIQLLYFIRGNIPLYLVHYRVKKDLSSMDYYDPLRVIVDSRIRDVCEYLKDAFFNGDDIYNMCINYIDTLSLNEVILFLARLLYPSYYYDIFDDIISGEKKDINKILDNTIRFEDKIKSIYYYASKKYMLPKIDWF